jgi:hypothetical protein
VIVAMVVAFLVQELSGNAMDDHEDGNPDGHLLPGSSRPHLT